MTPTTDQIMLTLAGLAYRGFQDALPGEPHEFIVRRAVLDGLSTLAPVRGDWELVWGPVTSRAALGVFDSNAMYVVRSRQARHRYVVAVRGTNPIASSDWLFGDFLIGTIVRWPYSTDGAAISTSTALGLAALQGMRARPPSTIARFAEASSAAVGDALHGLVRAGRASVSGTTDAQVANPSSLDAQVERIMAHWSLGHASRDRLRDQLRRAGSDAHLEPAALRRTLLPAGSRDGGLDLLTFLRSQADEGGDALDVAVTGHSKGGALAPTVALWLRAALDSMDPEECWDATRRARVSCHGFAGPTPGNSAFARQVEQRLGENHHHLKNVNDLATHAWRVDDLRQIPDLYGSRSAPFGPLVSGVIESVRDLDYRHPQVGVVQFAGKLESHRSLVVEAIHQHLDAYLAELGLLDQGISAVVFFI